MVRNCLRFLLAAAIFLLSGFAPILQAFAAEQAPGDELWAGDLTLSGFDNRVMKLVKDMQGNVYAGGDFTAFGGQAVSHVAKWDGSTWSGLGSGLEHAVNTLAVDSRGTVYADILVVPDVGLPETVVMRWDGVSWSALPGDLSSLVDTLAEGRDSNILINEMVVDSQDQLYAGGYFYLIQADRYVGYVARWDGSSWTLLGSGMNHTVYQLAVDGQDNLYASGEFTSAGGVSANRVAKWDGTSWSALGSGLGGEAPLITDIEADQSGNLFVTGQFESAGDIPIPLIAMWDGASWKNLTPEDNRSWFEGESPIIFDLSVDSSGDLYAAGSFSAIDGVEAYNVAMWDGAAWHPLSTMDGNGVNERAFAATIDRDGHVFVGGMFSSAGGLPANHIARWDGSSWFGWNEAPQDGVNNILDALALDQKGGLYIGGYFTFAGTTPANRVAYWDGINWHALAEGVNAAVHALALDGSGSLYAGGDFTAAGQLTVNRIARWDGARWSPLGEGVTSDNTYPGVRALAIDGQGNLYAGGDFTIAGGETANFIARWDGSTWSALGLGMDDMVTGLAVDPQGNLYAAGWFKSAGGVEAHGIARWDGSNWSALGSETIYIEAIAIGPQGELYAAGMFFSPDRSTSVYQIARWDGSTWTRLGDVLNDMIQALAVDQEGNLYAGGNFTSVGELVVQRIARWDGISWNPLGSGIGSQGDYSSVSAMLVDSRGDLYVGGQFTLAGKKPSANLAKWCAGLNTGGCTLAFKATVSSPEPTPSLTMPVPTMMKTTATNTAEPGLVPTQMPAGAVEESGTNYLMGVGAVVILTILLAVGVYFIFRRSRGKR